MRVAVYGGSFNPPHVGHAMVVAWLRWTRRADQVWLLPCFDHPFEKELAPFAQRVAMCEALVTLFEGGARVETIESELPAPSYTIDTLDALAKRFPKDQFSWVLGADLLPTVTRWKRWDRISAEYSPILVGREGYPPPDGALCFPNVSSTDIRNRVRTGQPIEHLVPEVVRQKMGDLFRVSP